MKYWCPTCGKFHYHWRSTLESEIRGTALEYVCMVCGWQGTPTFSLLEVRK